MQMSDQKCDKYDSQNESKNRAAKETELKQFIKLIIPLFKPGL